MRLLPADEGQRDEALPELEEWEDPGPLHIPLRGLDLMPYVGLLSISTKDTGERRLGDAIRWPQKLLLRTVSRNLAAGRSTRIIVLKARQLGFSTIIGGVQYTLASLVDQFRGQVVSHESKSTTHLLDMTQHFHDTSPFREMYDQRNRSANLLRWEPTDSRIGVNTAKTLEGGRSQTIHFLHGSEVAFWPDATGLMRSLGTAVPKTPFSFVFLESTANGVGNWFHSTWEKAVSAENDYIPMFVPWQTNPEYTAHAIGIEPLIVGADDLDAEEEALVVLFRKSRLDDETKRIFRRTMDPGEIESLSAPMSDAEIGSRLAWRRYVIRNDFDGDLDSFHQEYPTTPMEAFIVTGANIFPEVFLNRVYKPDVKKVRGEITRGRAGLVPVNNRCFSRAPDGPLTLYRFPSPDCHYTVAGDPTWTLKGDYAVAQVLDRRTWEQVATWRGRCTPDTFGDVLAELGWYYNCALVAPEANKDGQNTIARLLALAYPNIYIRQDAETIEQQSRRYGWFSNTKHKPRAIGALKQVVMDGSLEIHDPDTYREMRAYVVLDNGSYGNASGEPNDDTVMSLGIAVAVTMDEAADLLMTDSFMNRTIADTIDEANRTMRTLGTLEAARRGEDVTDEMGDDW